MGGLAGVVACKFISGDDTQLPGSEPLKSRVSDSIIEKVHG
jgi:hypothetical protein